jgi:putative FmdB family regulatory protein
LFFRLFLVAVAGFASIMPIYEYRCSACGFEKDALQKLSDPPLVECPRCGKPELVKLVSAPGFQLKGSGWYATDFKSSGTKPAQEKSETAKSDGGATASDTKGGDAKAAESKTSDAKSGSTATSSGSGSKPAPADAGD